MWTTFRLLTIVSCGKEIDCMHKNINLLKRGRVYNLFVMGER